MSNLIVLTWPALKITKEQHWTAYKSIQKLQCLQHLPVSKLSIVVSGPTSSSFSSSGSSRPPVTMTTSTSPELETGQCKQNRNYRANIPNTNQTSVRPVVPRSSTPSPSKSSTPLPHCCGTREQQWLSARTGNQFTVYNDYLLVWKGHWITVHNDYLPAWKGLPTCLEGTTYLPGKDYLPRGKGQRIIVNSVYLPRRKRQWIIVHYILAWIG